MVFGRTTRGGRGGEPLPPVLDWRDVTTFTVGGVERQDAKGGRTVFGPRAVRVPRREGAGRVFPPCALIVAPDADTSVLYEDRETRRVLCTVGREGGDRSGGDERYDERCYVVRDAAGREIGRVRRVPPARRLLRHTWRVEQPGHPEIAGRNKWAALSRQDAALHAAGSLVGGVVDSVLSFGAEGGDAPRRDRTLLWTAGDEEVMRSEGADFRVKAPWVDRRLAFAVATIGDR
ncbi:MULTISPECIES: hypothetical protein [Streptomyces]|uniref:hypothetical protein n=1 Tax=Streptomyces TaxID=1883 RepID=UPI00163D37E3|nr:MULTISPECIES: hypothetical protein [Streptomyces]MBC2874036.1 hypothetical protein [Streptomyces sp. TYQ1024]UBI39029.1 hypothetical protein K7I03_22940 [Streptomyces mobaraensis]UKW31607.1 hypothetical protein MCU78_22885 [Streptomyces sp. TYQ1024]